ncbi:UPF0496 protein At3g19330-like isoform X1 [Prosopis cineraria]|uniref:UPF0496 protein At3g19330-like isoform X1 n=1 Tax=Prosopis cineraria TaxID=364024 RepID=UPI00240FD812|nr:UPF0496 protein At3g19330-like isoform X1 [Prosopis cineraria]
MLECLSFGSLTWSSAPVPAANPPVPGQGFSTETTPVTSTQSSPALNVVSREFNRTIQGDSYQEIRSIIQIEVFDPSGRDLSQDHPELVDGPAEPEGDSQRKILEKVLQPDRYCVQEALAQPKPNSLTRLVSSYFDHSETASELCLLLHRSLNCARSMYAPLLDLLSVLSSDSNHLTQPQCDYAFDVFFRFDAQNNPFPSHDSHDFSNMRSSFSDLDRQLHRSLRKSRSKLRLLRGATNGSALCFVAGAVGVVVSAVVVTTHALVAIAAAAPVCPAYISPPKNPKKKELSRLAQLEAASKGTYTLNKDLDTIDRLVARLHGAVEADKRSVRLGLEMGKNRYAMQEVIKHLRRDSKNFLLLMEELETRIYICLNFVNKTRWNLFREICLHQNA